MLETNSCSVINIRAILIVIIQNSERTGFFKFSPVFLGQGIWMLSVFEKKLGRV